MNIIECSREREITEIVACGRWPESCPAELRDHAARCTICSDAIEVALAFREDREDAILHARVPPPGLVWWRAELRARQEAMRKVSRPMTFVQAFGGACATGVVVAVLSQVWPWFEGMSLDLPIGPDLSAMTPLLAQWGTPLVLAVALGLIIAAPVAMYLVFSDE